MPAVRLEDIIDVVVFQDLPSVESTKLNRFLDGGVVVQSELLNTLANGPGKTAELPLERLGRRRRGELFDRRPGSRRPDF